MNEQIEALFVPYSLGLLSPEERRAVEQYVSRHPEAETRLGPPAANCSCMSAES